ILLIPDLVLQDCIFTVGISLRNRHDHIGCSHTSHCMAKSLTSRSYVLFTISTGVLSPSFGIVILGGAGIGSGIGGLAHHARTMLGDRPPKSEIPSPSQVLQAHNGESDAPS